MKTIQDLTDKKKRISTGIIQRNTTMSSDLTITSRACNDLSTPAKLTFFAQGGKLMRGRKPKPTIKLFSQNGFPERQGHLLSHLSPILLKMVRY
jgi:hypothetical protein